MKLLKSRKALIACLLVGVMLVAVCAVLLVGLFQNKQLEQLRNEALEELERDIGQYDDQSIVLYQTSKAQAEELAELLSAELRITEDGRFAKLTLAEGTTIRDVYANDEMLEHIEKMSADYQVHVSELTDETEDEETGERLPTRPQYSVSDTDYALQTYLDYLNMKNVWKSYTGNGVTVAVIDTGIDTDHPEFAGRISEYSYNATEDKIVKDWLTEDGEYDWSLIEDEVGHGTAVTGVIAASMNSGNVVGIAPNVNVIVIKAECDENGNFKRTSDLVFGLYYAIERDVNVVNMSFGTYGPNVFAEALQLAYDSDVVCVAAAGNDGTSALMFPAADEHAVGVGALEANSWALASYSNYGENTDLVAPGSTYTTLMGGTYGTKDGTSLASPIVTGAVALFLQKKPYITVDDVTEVLYASCVDLGDLGNDWLYGFGALDLSALLLEERGTVSFDMLTDELENTDALFIKGHTLQELPEPERLYAVFDGWYYDDTFTQEYVYYEDKFYNDITLYAKWVNEDDGVPYTYVELEDGTIEIRSYTGKRRFITIPERIDGKIVSSIGEEAFKGQTRLREVGLPSGLIRIRRSAFEGCANLIWIEIPENVTAIGASAFADNTRLSTVAFLGNSKLKTVGDYAFSHCGKLELIELPASLEGINATAFYADISLHTIRVQAGNKNYTTPDDVLYNATQSTLIAYPASRGNTYTISEATKEIGELAFAFAQIDTVELATVETIGESSFVFSTLDNLAIPDSVARMGDSAFASNAELSAVTIGRGLSVIASNAFSGCSQLKNVLIPKGIERIYRRAFQNSGLEHIVFEDGIALKLIGEQAFYNCSISKIDIPATVTEIGAYAFSGSFVGNPLIRVGFAQGCSLRIIGEGAFEYCNLLEKIDLPAGLETIDNFAFASTALTGISVPASVTFLGNGVFAYCSDLPAIEIEEGNAVYHDLDGIVYTLDNVTICAYPAAHQQWRYSLEEMTRTIAPYSFAGTAYLSHVTLPEGLTVIGESAFNCCGASGYTLPSTLTNIKEYAFYKNVNLNSLKLPDALIQIAEGAFSKCFSLTSLHIPDNVIQIGYYAFALDRALHFVTFNETSNLPRISYGAFAYTGITSFTIPANVSTMAQGAFYGCNSLTSVTFAANSKLESISAYMFDGCTNLQNINFMQGSALTSIQAHGLEGMTRLQSIDLTNTKLTNIDNFAFRFCESLNSLTLPDTVKNVGRYAFYACKSLSALSLPEAVEHIGSYAFLGTNELDLYLASESMPAYLDENWDHGIRGYYTGVSSVVEDGDYKYAVLASGNIAIIEYLGTETTVDLTTVDFGAPIITIGGSAFKGSTVTSIVLPETLTTIQAEAFQYTALESVAIPASVTFIGREAFAHTDIQTLTFANDSMLNVIEQYAFEGTENLTSVTLPRSVTTLGTGVFQKSGLTSVTFEQGIDLKEIPQNAFLGTKLTTVTLPDSVETVNHNAFRDILTLKTVDFGNSDGIRLLSNVFYNTGLETLHIPANVTFIGEYCFVGLENLTDITVDANNPNYVSNDGLLLTKSGRKLVTVPAGRTGTLTVPLSVEEIGFGAFENTALDEILFDENANILTFGYRAFFGAKNLTEIHVPASVVSIDYYAFAYCEKLQTVTFAEGNKLKGIYEGAFCGDINLENITIPDSIVEISDFAFYGCTKIDKLPLGENSAVKGIYDYAFAYTSIGGEFTTPETLVDIGAYAFLGTDITKLTIPDTNKKDLIIGIGAFEECNKLTEVTLPFIGASYEDDELSWFGYIFGAGAYEANQTYVPESLKTVTITDGITFVGIGGFAECTSLETINVPHSVSVLWNDAFKDTTARYELTNTIMTYYLASGVYPRVAEGHFGEGICQYLVLSDEITEISSCAFYNCSYLNGVDFPMSLTSIGMSAFSGCCSLTEIILPDNISTIEFGAFSNCSNLSNIILPKGLLNLGGYAFSGCGSLTCIELPERLNEIGHGAFDACYNITEVYVKSVTALCNISFQSVDSNPMNYGATLYIDGVQISDIAIPSNITAINRFTFAGCLNLTEVFVPEEVLSIGEHAFANCTGLTNIVIPENVSSIGEYAFLNCSMLSSLILPDNVVAIGRGAFGGCYGLTSIQLPDGLSAIEYALFYDCTSLTEIVLPDSIIDIGASVFANCSSLQSMVLPNNVTTIGEHAFANCSRLKSITLPAKLKAINGYAFAHCDKLTNITLPEHMESIEYAAFQGCTSLCAVYNNSQLELSFDYSNGGVAENAIIIIDNQGNKRYREDGCEYFFTQDQFLFSVQDDVYTLNAYLGNEQTIVLPTDINGLSYRIYRFRGGVDVIVPDSITVIGEHAFEGCPSLTSIAIPESVTEIGDCAFMDCDNLTNITIPNSVTSFGWWIFSECENLESAVLPNNMTSIPTGLFKTCISLTNIVLSDKITTIEDYAFMHCQTLTSVVFPEELISIGNEAFYGCNSLTDITFEGELPALGSAALPECATISFLQSDKYHVRDGVVYNQDYTAILYVDSSITEVTLPNSIISLEGAFQNCRDLASVVLPERITYIGDKAFYNCTSLTEIVLPGGVQSIGQNAFSGCTSLTEIVLPGGVQSIGQNAFSGCTSLTEIILPSGVQSIGMSAFSGCSSLKNITIPGGVDAIRENTFSGCTSLTKIVLPDSVEYIGQAAFQNCSDLAEVVFSENITSVGDYSFYGCTSLNRIVLPTSLQSIGYGAFKDCNNLSSVVIPDGLTTLGSVAFENCSGLVSIMLPDGLESIGYSAFENCKNLSNILLPDSIQTIGSNAFSGCTSLTSIVLPSNLDVIEYGVFKNCCNLVNIHLPESITSIGYYAFSGCNMLDSIELPDGLTFIGGSAFENCRSLSNIQLSEGVLDIAGYTFSGCTGLTSVILPTGLTSIGQYAFSNCNGLISITLPQSLMSIQQTSFSECSSLYVVHNESALDVSFLIHGCPIKMIVDAQGNVFNCDENAEFFITEEQFLCSKGENGYVLYAYLGNEQTVTLPTSVDGHVYSVYCFRGAPNVSIPNGTTTVGDYAFYNCHYLNSVVLPNSVTNIGESAFENCSGLVSIMLPDGLESIGYSAFKNCCNLVNIHLPESITSIGYYAFSGCTNLYQNGVLLIGGYLFDVAKDTKYLSNIESIKMVMEYAYSGCDLLKSAVWNGTYLTNVETLVVTKTNGHLINTLTLKNVVVSDLIIDNSPHNITEFFSSVSNITIFVEALEEDLRWDYSFPGWNNGNRVYYGDEWSWVHFYDENGIILYSEPRPNSAIVRRPVYEPQSDAQFTAELIGWDLNGDGVADSVPATTNTDLHAVAVVEHMVNEYTVTFIDPQTQEVYSRQKLPYGALIELPTDPERAGYVFEGWDGYTNGMTVTEALTFTAKWHEHVIVLHDAKAPTCISIGWDAYDACVNCDYTTYVELPATGHAYDTVVTAPTCTEEGYTTHTCSVCGDTYTDSITSATGHAMGDWYTVTASTCTTTGTEQRDCANCDYSETRTADALGHDLVVYNSKAPTCTEIGWNEYETCSRCDYTTYIEVPATGHSYSATVTPPTCTAEGYTTHTCSVCGDSYTDNVVQSTGHVYNAVITAPTCTAEGYTTHTCSTCGDTYTDSITSATGHAMCEWYTVTAPTCTNAGTEQRDCANCDYSETRTVDALGHDLIAHDAKTPKCTEIGWDAYETCSRCDYTTYTEVPATGHIETTILVDPTCTEDGYRAVHCATCFVELSHEVLPATGHNHVDGVCTACGDIAYIYGDCNGDGKVNSIDVTRLLRYLADYNPVSGESTVEVKPGADCNGDGKINGKDATRLLQYLANYDPTTGESTVTLGPKE